MNSDFSIESIQTDHLFFPKYTEEWAAEIFTKHPTEAIDRIQDAIAEREQLILLERQDPYRGGVEMFNWKDTDELVDQVDMVMISGGNRASKTEYMAKKGVKLLCEKKNQRVLFTHTSHSSSLQVQQPIVWKYLPPEFKVARKTKTQNVNYSVKNGFSQNRFVLPNGSIGQFANYTMDVTNVEGTEYDMIVGDELMPLNWVETLKYRLVTRRGKFLLGFTPIEGVTNTYREVVSGCRVTEYRDARLFEGQPTIPGAPTGKMPYKAMSRNGEAAIIWFYTEDNPFTPWDAMVNTVKNVGKTQRMIRAYGWATDMGGRAFPSFNEQVHIIKREDIPTDVTRYMIMDPAENRPFFMLWAAVDSDDRIYIYREYPTATEGEWALPGEKPDGKPGPGQLNVPILSIPEYCELVRELEGRETIVDRLVDPRAGGSPKISEQAGTTLIDLFLYPTSVEGLNLNPAPGIAIDQGLAQINALLSYNRDEPVVRGLNEPKLYVSEDCKNLIFCLSEYTGKDGGKGAMKDPIDCLRYLVTTDPKYVGKTGLMPTRPRSY